MNETNDDEEAKEEIYNPVYFHLHHSGLLEISYFRVHIPLFEVFGNTLNEHSS
jgi:hypothetical protein